MKERKIEKQKELKKAPQEPIIDRPTGIWVYLVLLAIGTVFGIIGFESSVNIPAIVLGAVLTGGLLVGYHAFWLGVSVLQIYGIWMRKEWALNLTIAVLAVQILLILGSIFYIGEAAQLAMASSGANITPDQRAQAIETAKTIGPIVDLILAGIYAAFLWVFHKNRAYFSE